MSELTLMLIRLGFLALLWMFVMFAVSVIRTDLFGAKTPKANRPEKPQKQPKPAKTRRGTPTQIVILEGSNQGEVIKLIEPPILIGRGSDATIRLDDDYVSTRHASINTTGTDWYVEDLGSTNGTYLGSNRVTEPTGLIVGTQIRIGKTLLELRK